MLPARILIGAPQGRSGKTTISLGLCAALTQRGVAVQPFKKGPDYIDPSWLSEAAQRPCRSLDGFFMPHPTHLRAAFLAGAAELPQAQAGAAMNSLCLVEGNHGLYDSTEPDGHGSAAHTARLLNTPIVLVVNTARMGRSIAALVLGYQRFEPDTPIAGVILNNVAQARHETRLRQAVESTCGVPVLGALPRDAALTIPDRHLGLVPRSEDAGLLPAIEACRQAVEQGVDLHAVLRIAGQAPAWPAAWLHQLPAAPPAAPPGLCRLGVLRDRAFSFYYPENLAALQHAGAELVFINALADPDLPAIDGLYIGGGFPEMFMDALSANRSLRQQIRRAIEAGLPVYAECGGLMYLSTAIRSGQQRAEMVGVFPFEVEMTARPQGHGYVQAVTTQATPFFEEGVEVRGHEFHHSRLVGLDPGWRTQYLLQRGVGLGAAPPEPNGGQAAPARDGLITRRVVAGYTHIHTAAAPHWADAFVNAARGRP